MIIQPSLSELARQGNPKAIASLITRSLKVQGITAKASLKEGCLQILLEAQQVPEQEATVQFIRKGLTKLRAECIKRVKLYGKQVDQDFPAWSQELDLEQQVQDTTHKPPQAQRTQPNLSEVSHQSDLSNSLLNTPNSIAQADIAQLLGNPTTTRDSTKPSSQDFEAKFKAANVPKRLGQTLTGFLGLQIGCESLFVIYAIVWATYYYIYNLLDVADVTGILPYLIRNLVVAVDYFFYPLEFITVWIYRLSFLIMLIWLHRLHASLRTINRGYPITPWGAITRFAIPFYSWWGIWNLFTTLASWFKSQGSELARRGASLLRWVPWFYVALIASNVLNQIYWYLSRTTADGDLSPWFFVAKNGARLFLAVVWLQIVHIISKGISQALHNQNHFICHKSI